MLWRDINHWRLHFLAITRASSPRQQCWKKDFAITPAKTSAPLCNNRSSRGRLSNRGARLRSDDLPIQAETRITEIVAIMLLTGKGGRSKNVSRVNTASGSCAE